VIGVE